MKFRHEYKHQINLADIFELRTRLNAVAKHDSHAGDDGTYFIKSLYFDNYMDKALREKLDGVNKREKFRIRYYGTDTSFIRIEKKSKINGLCNKVTCRITAEECQKIIDGDIAVDSTKELASKKGIQLRISVPEGTIVYVDESLLLSAITNLISNGIKYGNESGYVDVSASKVGDKTEIIVSDNGIGISEEHINKIWTRFYRVDNVRNDEYGSSGLGLSMVKSIIELHGGEITVESVLEQGTEFKILL